MKRIVTHLALTATMAMIATGCVPVRHNMPPEQRMMQPGPGVGGPGPGVLGPPPYRPAMGSMPAGAANGCVTMDDSATANGGTSISDLATGTSNPEISQVGYDQVQAQTAGFRQKIGSANAADCGCGGHGEASGGGQVIPPGGGVMMMSGMPGMISTAQVTFGSPDGMHVRYDVSGSGMFDSEPLVVPARQNFPQGGLYRLKLTNIPSRPGVELYPTVELAYANPRTGAYLAHNSVPLQFTEEDFDQVLTGNFVTKVIYLPDPEFQGPAIAGIDTLVSTRLDPGIDPIVEADRRGSILAIIRLGDKDIEMAGAGMAGLVGGGMMGPPITGLPSPFAPAMTDGCGTPSGPGAGKVGAPPSLPGMIAGVNAPQYGMPYTGTPIGLPGPPHIPLGAPAGLQSHTIRNRTHMHMPQPVQDVRIDVRQQPGMSYPNPVSRIRVTEQNIHPGVPNARPGFDRGSERVY
ncbi:hypothetical protein [Aporhodopirellula aestuarii]|uniref:Uncharacterized protein n=1 Tax=Aporhodopirellula aestuarii TaxID=2950107 RepID=A0ABT0U0Z3_9BACT|nr:hypothetical protein [Aporhodopirellula aestuarii]MCM2370546.1 hypothetical protein [Aporhodopirellula aestuarii]